MIRQVWRDVLCVGYILMAAFGTWFFGWSPFEIMVVMGIALHLNGVRSPRAVGED